MLFFVSEKVFFSNFFSHILLYFTLNYIMYFIFPQKKKKYKIIGLIIYIIYFYPIYYINNIHVKFILKMLPHQTPITTTIQSILIRFMCDNFLYVNFIQIKRMEMNIYTYQVNEGYYLGRSSRYMESIW